VLYKQQSLGVEEAQQRTAAVHINSFSCQGTGEHLNRLNCCV